MIEINKVFDQSSIIPLKQRVSVIRYLLPTLKIVHSFIELKHPKYKGASGLDRLSNILKGLIYGEIELVEHLEYIANEYRKTEEKINTYKVK